LLSVLSHTAVELYTHQRNRKFPYKITIPLLQFVIQRQDPPQKLENGSSNSHATIADWEEEVSKRRKRVSTRQLPPMAAFSESFNKVIDVSRRLAALTAGRYWFVDRPFVP